MVGKTYTCSLEGEVLLAQELSCHIRAGDVITLCGDLGVGKTTFARALIQQLVGESCEVLSPTFTLVQPYEAPLFTIWHFDVYRLRSASEIIEIGLQEALDTGVSIIEWPERIVDYLPPERLDIKLTFLKEDVRNLQIKGEGKWKILGY